MSDIIVIRGQRHVVWECGTCGVVATCPEIVLETHRRQGGYHHCPSGHPWGWSKDQSEDARIRRERDRLKQEQAMLNDEIRRQRELREQAERSASAYKGQTTRLKNRAKAGLCPCCNRHFTNLERHIATKHPDISVEDDGVVVPLHGRKSA